MKIIHTLSLSKDLYWLQSKDDTTEDQLTTLVYISQGVLIVTSLHIEEQDSSFEWFYSADKDWRFSIFLWKKEITRIHKKANCFPQFKRLGGPTFTLEMDCILWKKTGFCKINFNIFFAKISNIYMTYKVNVIKP